MDKPTQAIAHYAATLGYDDLTPDAVHTSKRMLIDAAACAPAASPMPPAIAARAIAGAAFASPPAHVLISGEPTTPDLAAYAGALMVRYWDLNDTYLHGGHPSDAIPGVLAVAELTGANGKDTLIALTIAYEIFGALSDAPGMLATSAGGRIAMGDGVVFDEIEERWVPPHLRQVGYVPQSPSLMPRLTVAENVAFWAAFAGNTAGVAAALERLDLGALGGGCVGPGEGVVD